MLGAIVNTRVYISYSLDWIDTHDFITDDTAHNFQLNRNE